MLNSKAGPCHNSKRHTGLVARNLKFHPRCNHETNRLIMHDSDLGRRLSSVFGAASPPTRSSSDLLQQTTVWTICWTDWFGSARENKLAVVTRPRRIFRVNMNRNAGLRILSPTRLAYMIEIFVKNKTLFFMDSHTHLCMHIWHNTYSHISIHDEQAFVMFFQLFRSFLLSLY